jgi:hypothetical protein
MNIMAGITALILGFCLMGCAQLLQKHALGCKQSTHVLCPK